MVGQPFSGPTSARFQHKSPALAPKVAVRWRIVCFFVGGCPPGVHKRKAEKKS